MNKSKTYENFMNELEILSKKYDIAIRGINCIKNYKPGDLVNLKYERNIISKDIDYNIEEFSDRFYLYSFVDDVYFLNRIFLTENITESLSDYNIRELEESGGDFDIENLLLTRNDKEFYNIVAKGETIEIKKANLSKENARALRIKLLSGGE